MSETGMELSDSGEHKMNLVAETTAPNNPNIARVITSVNSSNSLSSNNDEKVNILHGSPSIFH